MIKVNDKEIEVIETEVTWGNYMAQEDGKKREGLAPYITFSGETCQVGLELSYDYEWLKELPINMKQDITKYVTDFNYESEDEEWVTLMCDNYNCSIEKLAENKVRVEAYVKDENEGYEIEVNETFKFEE